MGYARWLLLLAAAVPFLSLGAAARTIWRAVAFAWNAVCVGWQSSGWPDPPAPESSRTWFDDPEPTTGFEVGRP